MQGILVWHRLAAGYCYTAFYIDKTLRTDIPRNPQSSRTSWIKRWSTWKQWWTGLSSAQNTTSISVVRIAEGFREHDYSLLRCNYQELPTVDFGITWIQLPMNWPASATKHLISHRYYKCTIGMFSLCNAGSPNNAVILYDSQITQLNIVYTPLIH